MNKNYMEICFMAKLCNVTFSRTVVAGFLMSVDLMLNELNEIKTIVSEAVTNAIVHGYKEDDEKIVYLSLNLTDDVLTMIIEDKGCGIENVAKAREPLFSTKLSEERAGLGFTIMEIFSDDIEVISKVGEGTKVICHKKITLTD